MKIEHTNCLVCNSSKMVPSFKCKDHFVSGESFEIHQCTDCGFLFTQGIPSSESIAPYYKSEEYISHSNTQKGLVNKLYHKVRKLMLGRKYRLIKKFSPGKTLLDIGCGTGYFPYYMKSKGFDVSGMELDADARNFAAENFDLEIHAPEDLLSKEMAGNYDVITLWHVLEHLHDADRYMKWVHNSLADNGALIIALPNCNSFDAEHYQEYWAAYDVPRHLWHFTPVSLAAYLLKFGFELKRIERLPFDAYYNSLLSEKYKGGMFALFAAFAIGLISNLKSQFQPNSSSSVIYVLRKK